MVSVNQQASTSALNQRRALMGVEGGRGYLDAGPGTLHKNIARNMSLAEHAQAQRLAPQLREGLEDNVFAHVKVGEIGRAHV